MSRVNIVKKVKIDDSWKLLSIPQAVAPPHKLRRHHSNLVAERSDHPSSMFAPRVASKPTRHFG